ncbi:MAG: hypothetical protein ACYC6W_09690 [Nitrosotalea sp.]
MKLQKAFSYKYGGTSRFKYLINIPEEVIDQLGWESGSELSTKIVDDKHLLIEFISEPSDLPKKITEPKMSYEEFRDKIKKVLEYSDKGMTWTELRNRLKLDQVVPNNKWVRELEKDIGLMRLKEMRGIVWRINHV